MYIYMFICRYVCLYVQGLQTCEHVPGPRNKDHIFAARALPSSGGAVRSLQHVPGLRNSKCVPGLRNGEHVLGFRAR